MESLLFHSQDEQDTARVGAALAGVLTAGNVVTLDGPLGAGKTRIVQSLCEALGVPPSECVSPTFMLINEYQGRLPIYHFDAYRINDDDEFLELGPDEYFEGPGISLVEWAQRVEACLPGERLEIRITPTSLNGRAIEIRARGRAYENVVNRLRQELATA